MSYNAKRKNSTHQHHQKRLLGLVVAVIIAIGGLLVALTQPTTAILSDENIATPACYWNWAYGEVLPQHIDIMHAAIMRAGYTDYELTASAYGEDYICQTDDEIVSSQFHLMDITPTITLPVTRETLNNPPDMGARIRHIINAMLSVSNDLPKISRIDVHFVNDDTVQRWSAAPSDFPMGIPFGMTDRSLFESGKQ